MPDRLAIALAGAQLARHLAKLDLSGGQRIAVQAACLLQLGKALAAGDQQFAALLQIAPGNEAALGDTLDASQLLLR